tara:strand:- start:1701 stop:1925 length:225 start_codon:yes stop_codon:yes gene_type:complete
MSSLKKLEEEEQKVDMLFVEELLQKLNKNSNHNFLDINSNYTEQQFHNIINKISEEKKPAVALCLSNFLNKNKN